MIRNVLIAAAATTLLALSSPADARETRLELSLQELVNSPAAREAGIDGSVRFYLAGQSVAVQQRFGEDVANRKTNAANKSDEEACRWVALSTLRALQDVHEAILGTPLGKPAFRRRMIDTGWIEGTGEKESGGAFRPAELYRVTEKANRQIGPRAA